MWWKNIVGGDCQRLCEIASVVWWWWGGQWITMILSNIQRLICGHLALDGHTHTLTRIPFPPWNPQLVYRQPMACEDITATHTYTHWATPGSEPSTVNMFGPPSDRRLIQRECCKLSHAHTHTYTFFLRQQPRNLTYRHSNTTAKQHTDLQGSHIVHLLFLSSLTFSSDFYKICNWRKNIMEKEVKIFRTVLLLLQLYIMRYKSKYIFTKT